MNTADYKFNATRQGLTGQQFVLNGESAADYDTLHRSVIAENQPASEDEAMLVERIAQNYWKLLRAERYEQQIFDYFAAINEDVFASKRYANYMRYRNAVERSWNRARSELASLKKAAQKADAKNPPARDASKKSSKPAAAAATQSVSYMTANGSSVRAKTVPTDPGFQTDAGRTLE